LTDQSGEAALPGTHLDIAEIVFAGMERGARLAMPAERCDAALAHFHFGNRF
jgi:hypothetical protein